MYFYDKKSNIGKVTRRECLGMLKDLGIRMNNADIMRLFKVNIQGGGKGVPR